MLRDGIRGVALMSNPWRRTLSVRGKRILRDEERIYRHVRLIRATGCWEWQGATDKTGYGKFRTADSRRMLKAHRFAYKLLVGPIPTGLLVLHRCDNPPCCNPEHLYVGTHAENMRDAVLTGRIRRGEDNGRARLTEENVIEARRSSKNGEGVYHIAARLGVSHTAIQQILSGKTWRHVADDDQAGVACCATVAAL